jgi:hypothetical protein
MRPLCTRSHRPPKIDARMSVSMSVGGQLGKVAHPRASLSLTDLGSNPGADTVNQTVHPSGVGKLVAISMQRGDRC